jgi:hypothetical protein
MKELITYQTVLSFVALLALNCLFILNGRLRKKLGAVETAVIVVAEAVCTSIFFKIWPKTEYNVLFLAPGCLIVAASLIFPVAFRYFQRKRRLAITKSIRFRST